MLRVNGFSLILEETLKNQPTKELLSRKKTRLREKAGWELDGLMPLRQLEGRQE